MVLGVDHYPTPSAKWSHAVLVFLEGEGVQETACRDLVSHTPAQLASPEVIRLLDRIRDLVCRTLVQRFGFRGKELEEGRDPR